MSVKFTIVSHRQMSTKKYNYNLDIIRGKRKTLCVKAYVYLRPTRAHLLSPPFSLPTTYKEARLIFAHKSMPFSAVNIVHMTT